MDDILEAMNTPLVGAVSAMNMLTVLLVITFFLVFRRIIKNLFDRALERSHLEHTLKSFLSAAVNVVLWAVVLIIVAGELGIPVDSMVAVLGVIGLALSLSLQNLLENLFSGMTILATKPFVDGNFVDIDGTLGTVRSVGLFYTVLLTYDGKVVRLPNAMVAAVKVTNFSDNPYRRVDLEICVSYDYDPETVKAALREAFETTPGTVSDPASFIGVLDYSNNCIKYAFYVWIEAADFFNTKFAVTESVSRVFKQRGIPMAYNHLSVHVEKDQ